MQMNDTFSNISRYISDKTGQPIAFSLATASVLLWLVTGPIFGYSDTWQLIINSITNIVTYLMVFLIQNTQNRDGEAIQIKLDELIRANKNAHNVLLDLEELSADQLTLIKDRYEKLATIARLELEKGGKDTGEPSV